jgi:ornithine cyclodeaminase
MAVLVVGYDEVLRLLPMADCIIVMRRTLAALARGEGVQPLRSVVRPPDLPGFMAVMPGYAPGALGAKVLGLFAGNPALGKDTHQGVVVLLSPETGELVAVLDASAITAVRTAAVSAVATDVLARPEATRLAVIGAGVQARAHVAAIAAVRPLTDAIVVARDPHRTRACAAETSAATGLAVRAGEHPESAVRAADIIVTVTTSSEPVVHGDWLADGVHINAVGAFGTGARELDTLTMTRGRLYVDRRQSALAESGDLLLAGLGAQHIVGELGEVLIGAAPGRGGDGSITIFKSLGLAIEDVAAAAYVVGRARAAGVGSLVPF